MVEGEKRGMMTYNGLELKAHPELLEQGRRVYLEISNEETTYFVGFITEFDQKNNTLLLSSFDGKERREVILNEKVTIKLF